MGGGLQRAGAAFLRSPGAAQNPADLRRRQFTIFLLYSKLHRKVVRIYQHPTKIKGEMIYVKENIAKFQNALPKNRNFQRS
jgi:hypothetical protein